MPRRLLFAGLIAAIMLILGCGSANLATPEPTSPASSSLSNTNSNRTKSTSSKPTAAPTAAPTATPQPAAAIVQGGNFRSGPGTGFDIIQTLEVGTAVRLMRTKQMDDGGRWFYVAAGDQKGWIHSILLGLDGTETLDLPEDTQAYIAPTPKPTAVPVAQPKPAAPATTSGGRTGAICRDGSRSYATGRGACSHHGGVDHWLYGP